MIIIIDILIIIGIKFFIDFSNSWLRWMLDSWLIEQVNLHLNDMIVDLLNINPVACLGCVTMVTRTFVQVGLKDGIMHKNDVISI